MGKRGGWGCATSAASACTLDILDIWCAFVTGPSTLLATAWWQRITLVCVVLRPPVGIHEELDNIAFGQGITTETVVRELTFGAYFATLIHLEGHHAVDLLRSWECQCVAENACQQR